MNIFYGTLLISVFFAEGFYSKTSVKFGGKLELGSAKESCGVDLINIKTSSYGGGGLYKHFQYFIPSIFALD